MIFKDRTTAGQQLAEQLSSYADRPDLLILALPRGGVPVAFEVAKALHADLDVYVVRKLGVPGQPELAMGAIAAGGVSVLNQSIITAHQISAAMIEQVATQEHQELERRERLYRGDRPLPILRDRTIIVVDDGLATGATMRAALQALRLQQPAQLIVATPIAAEATCRQLEMLADRVICVEVSDRLSSIGYWYTDFSQTTDETVCGLLQQAREHRHDCQSIPPLSPKYTKYN